MVCWSLSPKWPILVHFCGMKHQKSNFSLIFAPYLSEAVEYSRCYFFENWFMKLKIYNLLKPLGTITQQNYWSFFSSELIYFAFFTMRHPVDIQWPPTKHWNNLNNHSQSKLKCNFKKKSLVRYGRVPRPQELIHKPKYISFQLLLTSCHLWFRNLVIDIW